MKTDNRAGSTGKSRKALHHNHNQQKSNVKSRLGINNRNLISKNKQRPNIIKRVESTGTSKELKLYTKHFDARSKIQSKQQKNLPKPKATANNNGKTQALKEKAKFHKGIAKRALDDLMSRTNRPGKQSISSINAKKRRNNSATVQASLSRESTFTGKSIKVVTKNDCMRKPREAQMAGKTLSITTTNMNKKKSRKPSPIIQMRSPKSTTQHHFPNFNYIKEEFVTTKAPLPAKMVISNLHASVTQDDIKELFGAVGTLQEARLTNHGSAEVVYANAEDAFAAYNKYNTRNLDGQPMILKITTAEEDSYRSSSSMAPMPGFPSASTISSNGRFSHQDTFGGRTGGGSTIRNDSTKKPVVFTVRL